MELNSKELSLQECQKASLEVLKSVSCICINLNLRYFLAYGTLIGAIRHKGFIPWDDDIDIMMPRKDYQKLVEYFECNKKLLKPLELFDIHTHMDYPYMIGRVSDTRYVIETHNEKDCGMGVFIDIYPMDGLGCNLKWAVKVGMKADHLASLCFQSTRLKYEIGTTKSIIKKALKLPVYFYAKVRGKQYFVERLEKLSREFSYDTSKYIACIVWLSGGKRDMFPKAWFEETIDCRFENYSFKIPSRYHEILSYIYGDYMKLPPLNEREGHHYYKTYRKE